MTEYLKEIWRTRFFWMSLVRMDLRAKYRGSALGMGWSLIQPIAMTTVFCGVSATLFHQEIAKFAPYVMTGLTLWSFFSQCTSMGCYIFHQAEAYIRQHPAPMAIYPIRLMLANTFHLLIALSLAIALSIWGTGFPGILPLLSLAPSLLLIMIMGWSISCLLGILNVYFRDVKHITEVALQILMYLTPIWYPEQLLRDKGLSWLVNANPIVPFLTLVRTPLLTHEVPSVEMYGLATIIAGCFFLLAALNLRQRESRLIFFL
jgi:ABC-type polysaccharide/polyol phosphate export permease